MCPGFDEYNQDILKQIEEIGPNCLLLLESFKKIRPKDWYRPAKGIIALRKNYDDKLIEQACKRGLYYGVTSYQQIKSILASNASLLPLPVKGGDYAKFA